jgi:hypothetical protein
MVGASFLEIPAACTKRLKILEILQYVTVLVYDRNSKQAQLTEPTQVFTAMNPPQGITINPRHTSCEKLNKKLKE